MPEPTVDRFMIHSPHTIGDDQSLSVAHRLMRQYQIRHLPVLHGGKLVGMLSHRGRHFIETLANVDPEKVMVGDAMSPDAFAVGPGTTLLDVAEEFADHRYGSADVVDKGRRQGAGRRHPDDRRRDAIARAAPFGTEEPGVVTSLDISVNSPRGSRIGSPTKAMSSTKAKILVVDDNAQNRALAEATLEDEGYDVVLATGGEEGIRAVEVERPDCVLLDVRMPGLDGFAVCARIRALPEVGDTPIVFLTALRDVDTFDQALRSGGDAFLTKPVRPTELVLRVRAALELRRMNAELRQHYDLVRRQRDDLMRLQLQKERLSSFVVHDLKNPVNSLDLHAQLLLREPDLPPRARESVLHMRSEARALLRLILNLLDISKSEEGCLAPHPRPDRARRAAERSLRCVRDPGAKRQGKSRAVARGAIPRRRSRPGAGAASAFNSAEWR